jgi:acyl-homoserine lactone acylase PvdQ
MFWVKSRSSRTFKLLVALFFCSAQPLANAQSTSATTDSLAKPAREVTIYRDTYGVPHVFGRTDASTGLPAQETKP